MGRADINNFIIKLTPNLLSLFMFDVRILMNSFDVDNNERRRKKKWTHNLSILGFSADTGVTQL